MEKVSVLLSVYRPNQKYLEEQLASLDNQTYENMEILIFDDCDSFGTGIGRGNSSICCNNRSDILWGIFIIWKYRRTQLWRNRKICTARE